MKSLVYVAGAFALLVEMSASVAAIAQATPMFQVTAREVILDVVVTDKAGHIVNDLQPGDFEILEDHAQQTLRSFEPPRAHLLPTDVSIDSTEELERKAPQAAVDVIVLDEMNTSFEDTAYARWAINKCLRAKGTRLDRPTELLAVSENNFRQLHGFTQNREVLLTAMNKHLTAYPWNLSQRTAAETLTERLALSLAALDQVAESTRGHAGRKNLIWVGRGFPSVNTSTLEGNARASLLGIVHQMLDRLRDARITLYTIDPTSLTTLYSNISNSGDLALLQSENGDDPFDADLRFTTLAPATGGTAYFSRNDVDRELDMSEQAAGNFYTLTYSPENHDEASALYRRIEVKLKRPGLMATTRNGYYAESPMASSITERKQIIFDMSSALDSSLSYTDVGFAAEKAKKGASECVLHIQPERLSWTAAGNGGDQADVLIEIGLFGTKRKLLARTVRSATLNTAAANGSSLHAPITVRVPLPPAPGVESVRIVVRDSKTGHMGTADLNLR
jgi:VWFA-related protein